MERLTERDKNGSPYYKRCFEFPCNGLECGEEDCDFIDTAVCGRIASYEDTGLEPGAVGQLKRIAQIFDCDPRDPSQLNVFCDKLEKIASDLEEGQLVMLSRPPIGGDWRFEESQERLEVRARLFRVETETREEKWDEKQAEVLSAGSQKAVGESDVEKHPAEVEGL